MEELKQRYKMLPLWARLLLTAVLGLAPAAYIYFDEGDTLQAQLDEVKTEKEQAHQTFEAARRKKANLPKLEEQQDRTEQQLLKAKKSLPESFRIEDVLQKTATIAKQTSTRMVTFKPGVEAQHRESYQYVELPITTEIEGSFGQIAAFFDRVAHLDGSIFLRHLDLARLDPGGHDDAEVGATDTAPKTPYQKAKEARAKLRVRAHFDLVVYRGMTAAELVAPAPAAPGGAGKGMGGKPDGAPPAPGAGAPPTPPPDGTNAPAAPAPAAGSTVSQTHGRSAAAEAGDEGRL